LIVFPPAYLSITRGTQQIGFLGLVTIAAFMEPLIMVMHEFGHALTAKALGLKVTVMTLGEAGSYGLLTYSGFRFVSICGPWVV
jgi:Zn-dependent protease